MQATVASYDDETRGGTVLLDDGVRLSFDGRTLRDDVRHLRVGQRVHLDVDGSDPPGVIGVSIH
ncbi:hypothetical protein [Solicola sp. PLA-1-18]|uniref:hypothetical protein n=1 Tax=Solicola sp. PLA-1-18 TaxID=3380532 RepID=UPI003B777554